MAQTGGCESATAFLGRSLPLHAARPPIRLVTLFHLGGLGIEFGRHQAQALCAREIETRSRNTEAVFGLVTQELRGQRHLGCYFDIARLGALCVPPGWLIVLNAMIGDLVPESAADRDHRECMEKGRPR
jgi:hypothetical protein